MRQNLFDLTGKRALITGGNSGLGLGFATGLAKAGADVVIWGRNEQKNRAAADKLRHYETRIESRIVDVSVEREVIDGMAAAVETMGQLDCVIANAGSVTVVPFIEMTSAQYHDLLATAQHGAFYTLREAARHMVARSAAGSPGGSLIITGSLSIFAGGPNMAHYAAAKGAVNSLSKGLAVELGRHGIRVNVVAVGMTMTEMIEANMATARPVIELTEARTPMGRIGRLDDLEGIAIYLASDLSRYHTGDTITIDGGHRASIY
jgi:NAD(P)-dependent dehydrogenase (short-subunit alcohol dehydrogenase family)